MIKLYCSKEYHSKTACFLMAVLFVFTSSCLNYHSKETILLVKNADDISGMQISVVDTSGISVINPEIRTKDNEAKIRLEVKEPVILILAKDTFKSELVIYPGQETCIDFKDSRECAASTGENENFIKYNKLFEVNVRKADSLSTLFMQAQSSDTFAIVRQKVSIAFDELLSQAKNEAINYIENNPKSISIFGVLNSTLKQTPLFSFKYDHRLYRFVDSAMQLHYPTHSYSIWLHKKISDYERMTINRLQEVLIPIGTVIPDLKLQALNNKILPLIASKKGITLLHLWTNDQAARGNNEQVKVIYEKYKSAGLNITSVSFDENRKRWASEIELDKMWWNNLIDTMATRSEVLTKLNYPPLPSFIVVDGSRKVLAHFTSTYQLNDWLRDYFGRNGNKKIIN